MAGILVAVGVAGWFAGMGFTMRYALRHDKYLGVHYHGEVWGYFFGWIPILIVLVPQVRRERRPHPH